MYRRAARLLAKIGGCFPSGIPAVQDLPFTPNGSRDLVAISGYVTLNKSSAFLVFESGVDPSRTPTRSEPNRPPVYHPKTQQRLGGITRCAATLYSDVLGLVLAAETYPTGTRFCSARSHLDPKSHQSRSLISSGLSPVWTAIVFKKRGCDR